MYRFINAPALLLGSAIIASIWLLPAHSFAQTGGACANGQTTTSGTTSSSSTTQSSTARSGQPNSLISLLQQQLQSGTLTTAQQQRATSLLNALQRVQQQTGPLNLAQQRQVSSLLAFAQPQSNLAAGQAPSIRALASAAQRQNAGLASAAGSQRQFQATRARQR